MYEILHKVQVNAPFHLLVDKYLPLFIHERINPEVGISCFSLDRFTKNDFIRVAGKLQDAGLKTTIHGPFFDLRPGALDRKIRAASIERMKQVFDLVPYFRPETVVFHASFDERYYVSNEEIWLDNSRETWKYFAEMAAEMETVIALENVFENNPKYLAFLLETFKDSPHLCFCFDTGHCNAFSSRPLEEWMEHVGSYIGEVHLHDNKGAADDHAPVGDGNFPFHDFFAYLQKRNLKPVITLEPHTEKSFRKTLENLKTMKLLDYIA